MGKDCITDIKIALINSEKRIHLLAAEFKLQGGDFISLPLQQLFWRDAPQLQVWAIAQINGVRRQPVDRVDSRSYDRDRGHCCR